MIVLDANVLIAYLDDTHVYHQRAVEVLVSDDDLRIAPLTIAEVLVHPARTGDAAAVLSRLRAVGVTVDQGAADPIVLATLRAETPLKMPDAIVVELAIRLECAVESFDGRVVEVARGRAPTDRPPTVRPRQAGVASGAAAGAVGTQRLSEIIERVIRRVGIADRGGRFAAELRAEMESYWATTPADPMIVLTIRHVPVNDENDVIDGVRDLGLDPIVVINGDNEYDDDVEQGRPAGDAVAITLRRVRQSDVDRIAEMLQSIGVHSSLVISQASWAEVFDVIAEGEEATADPRPDIES